MYFQPLYRNSYVLWAFTLSPSVNHTPTPPGGGGGVGGEIFFFCISAKKFRNFSFAWEGEISNFSVQLDVFSGKHAGNAGKHAGNKTISQEKRRETPETKYFKNIIFYLSSFNTLFPAFPAFPAGIFLFPACFPEKKSSWTLKFEISPSHVKLKFRKILALVQKNENPPRPAPRPPPPPGGWTFGDKVKAQRT